MRIWFFMVCSPKGQSGLALVLSGPIVRLWEVFLQSGLEGDGSSQDSSAAADETLRVRTGPAPGLARLGCMTMVSLCGKRRCVSG